MPPWTLWALVTFRVVHALFVWTADNAIADDNLAYLMPTQEVLHRGSNLRINTNVDPSVKPALEDITGASPVGDTPTATLEA
ncbi:MAG TPA: hypothetical protein VMM79_07910 [Longimicrobiales bacterium]|nr:hypothetical protein [Longimicrobiales bacterium]